MPPTFIPFFPLRFVFGEVSKRNVRFITFCVKSFHVRCYTYSSYVDVETEFDVASLILIFL